MFQYIKLQNNAKLLPLPENHFTKGHRPQVSTMHSENAKNMMQSVHADPLTLSPALHLHNYLAYSKYGAS
jgi:hypothetical protein